VLSVHSFTATFKSTVNYSKSSRKFIFLGFIILATMVNTDTMVDFSSILFLALAIPNIIGLLIMSGDVREMLTDYMRKLKSGELDREAIRD